MDLLMLKKVLPDINTADPEIRKIMHLNVTHETKILNILSHYFKEKKSSKAESLSLNEEAYCIKNLFPSQSLSYILEQLEIFNDLPNRKEIILRIIVNSKMHDRDLISHSKSSTSNTQLTHKINDYYCQPIKIRKLTTGTASVYKVMQADNESWIPKPMVTPELVSESRINNNLHENAHNLEKQDSTIFANFPKLRKRTSPESQPNKQKLFVKGKIIEDIINLDDSVEKEKGTVNLKIIENELPVVKTFTSSSIQEPKEKNYLQSSELEIINDYIKEVMFTKEDQIPSTSFSDNHIIDENTLSVDRNCTIASNTVDVNSMDQIKQDFNWNLLPNYKYPNYHVNKLCVATLPENIDHRQSVLDKIAINDKLLPSLDETKILKIAPMVTDTLQMSNKNKTLTSTVPGRQEVASIVSSCSTSCIQENQSLEHTMTANNSTPIQDHDPENFNLVEYLYDITNAPLNIIRKECRKLNLSTSTRPDDLLLQLVLDNLLTNRISSESSNDEEEIEKVETAPPVADIVLNLSKRSNFKSTQSVQPYTSDNVPANPPHSLKPTATATVTSSQLQLDQAMSNELQKTATSVTTGVRSRSITKENPSSSVNNQLVSYLCGIFPDAAPDYIRELCKNKPMSNEVLDELTTVILSTNGMYPKRPLATAEPDVFPENQLEILKEFLPDADPDYLRMMCDKFEGKPDMVKSFINEAMERRNYPTMKDYQRRQQLSAQQKQYTTEFSVENFIKLIPDPHSFFSDPQRTIKMDSLSSHYALVFLRNTFNKLSLRIIQSTFTKNNCRLYNTVKELQQAMTQKHLIMKSTRKPMVMPNSTQNIPLLQEVAYFAHEKEINNYLQEIKDKEEEERKDALSKGIIKTCDCCYDEEVLPKDIFCCEKGCPFCKSCVIKSTEVRFGEGKLDFPCLMNCSSHFTLQTLQAVLSPKLFSKIAQKKALEEIKSAGIEELEMCPFCDFATIPAEGYNIFSCLNPECMKESCRLCKEPSHIPLRCEEIEKDEDVKARTFVENKMTEALLRKCWKCGIKFFKEEGCNKMTCSCGAQMCYVCGSPVTDYKHFNGNGGDRFDLCPLYSDTNVLNKENVLKGAAQAKAEIGNKTLKHDPTADVDQHYKKRATNVSHQHLVVNHRQRIEEAVFLGVREAIDRLEQRHHQFPF